MANPKNISDHVNLNGGFTGTNNPGAAVYYVAETTALNGSTPSDGNSGLSPQQAFATIQKGLDACTAARGDVVAVLPGAYAITAALTATKDDVTLTAAHPVGPREYPNVTISTSTDVSMLTVNANNVTVHSLRFDDNVTAATAGTAAIDVNSSSTGEDFSGVKILNCWIDQAGMTDSDRDGISLGTDADDGALAALVQGCTILEAGRDAIVINVGSEFTEIRNCKIFDAADVTSNGIKVLATSCTIDGCDILTSGPDGTGCIHNGVAAARMVANNNTLAAWGADTAGIYVIATATQRTHNNHITAVDVGNYINYITDPTTPSADTGFEALFTTTTPVITKFVTPTNDGA